jgi:hypothetical protein
MNSHPRSNTFQFFESFHGVENTGEAHPVPTNLEPLKLGVFKVTWCVGHNFFPALFLQLKLKDQALLEEIHTVQEMVGFGNPSF